MVLLRGRERADLGLEKGEFGYDGVAVVGSWGPEDAVAELLNQGEVLTRLAVEDEASSWQILLDLVPHTVA